MEKDYEGVPYIKYPDSASPITGRYLCPEGHPYYYAPLSQIIEETVIWGLINQARLWDAYDKCSHDVSVRRMTK